MDLALQLSVYCLRVKELVDSSCAENTVISSSCEGRGYLSGITALLTSRKSTQRPVFMNGQKQKIKVNINR